MQVSQFVGIKDHHDKVLYTLLAEIARKIEVAQLRRGPKGGARTGVEDTRAKRLLVDLLTPTNEKAKERRPDLLIVLKEEQQISIIDVAVP